MQFVPPVYYVGDRVELRIDYTLNSDMEIIIPDSLPEDELLTVHSLRVEEYDRSFSVFINFTPFAPGIKALPPIDLGAVNLKNVKISTHSMILNSHDGVRRPRGQLLLPGTRLAMAVVLAAVAMAPFFLYSAVRLAWKLLKRLKTLIRIHKPARRLRRQMKQLKAGIEIQPVSEWYLALAGALRVYLSTRLGYNCRCATTSEISALANRDDAPPMRIVNILKDSDMVIFARRPADSSICRSTLRAVEEAVRDWEKAVARL
ncbi:MAG: hypothetical protein B0D92_02890 [Spirochaeta sp. LUC14_002_19_P3]|nr:MAG: hypothetical protein B0D92_02890 [Spirochaeta sp. LUC14_002_19_P3]